MRFALKAPQRCAVAEHRAAQNFDGDRAIQARVGRFINRAHPAFAYQAFQTIAVLNGSLDGQRQS